MISKKNNRNILFCLILITCFKPLEFYASSLPTKTYKSTYDEMDDIALLSFEEQTAFYAQNPEIDPMLGGPPDLPPDPGEETPVGDYIPLILMPIAYTALKARKTFLSKRK